MNNGMIPVPPSLQPQSRVYDLKTRLDWGEPALTIVDVRHHDQFNASHIMGAISMPVSELVDRALVNFELERDIYVYAETDEETESAANALRSAGFFNVSELRGGLAAWKAVGYPIESTTAVVG